VNSVNEIPCSGRSSLARTDSFVTIWLTVKCLPTSRKKSSTPIGRSQSPLSTSTACELPAPAEKSKNLSICGRIPSRFRFIWSSSSSDRSSVLPPGSPTTAVPPPATAIG